MSEPRVIPPEITQLLEARARRLRLQRDELVEAETELLTAELHLGDELYAFRLEALRSVLPLSRVTPVPLSPPEVIGVVRFKGQLVTALSLPSLLRGRAWRSDPTALLIAEPQPGLLIGLDCEQVPRPSTLPRSLVEAAQGARGAQPSIELCVPGGRLVNLIDLEGLMARLPGRPHAG